MKHVTYADKSVLVGDEMADLLLEYAAALTTDGRADTVTVKAISSDGDDVEANFLLGPGAPIMNETANTSVAEPDNADVIADVRRRLERIAATNHAEQFDSRDFPDGRTDYDDGQSFSQKS